jgi:hypothetical protein
MLRTCACEHVAQGACCGRGFIQFEQGDRIHWTGSLTCRMQVTCSPAILDRPVGHLAVPHCGTWATCTSVRGSTSGSMLSCRMAAWNGCKECSILLASRRLQQQSVCFELPVSDNHNLLLLAAETELILPGLCRVIASICYLVRGMQEGTLCAAAGNSTNRV